MRMLRQRRQPIRGDREIVGAIRYGLEFRCLSGDGLDQIGAADDSDHPTVAHDGNPLDPFRRENFGDLDQSALSSTVIIGALMISRAVRSPPSS